MVVDARRLRGGVLGHHRLSRAPAPAQDPHRDLRAQLLHRSHAHVRRTPWRSGQPRVQRHRGPNPCGHARSRLEPRRSGQRQVECRHNCKLPVRAQLRSRAREPARALRGESGLRLSEGGCRQPLEAAPHPLLAVPRGLAPPRRPSCRLARSGNLRQVRGPVAVHTPGHAQDRREYRCRTRLRLRKSPALGSADRAAPTGEFLDRLPLAQRWRGCRDDGRCPPHRRRGRPPRDGSGAGAEREAPDSRNSQPGGGHRGRRACR